MTSFKASSDSLTLPIGAQGDTRCTPLPRGVPRFATGTVYKMKCSVACQQPAPGFVTAKRMLIGYIIPRPAEKCFALQLGTMDVQDLRNSQIHLHCLI